MAMRPRSRRPAVPNLANKPDPVVASGSKTRRSVAIGDVIHNPRNDNIHPQTQIDLLAESYKRFGQVRPILVRAQNRMIIAGHGVHLALRQAGATSVDIILWDVDQRTADGFLLADNRFGELSHRDPERRRDLLSEFDEEEFASMGFLAAEVEQLLQNTDALPVHEVETTTIEDTFWIAVRGPLSQQAQALRRISEVMSELPDVEVDLGTVAT